MSKASKIQLPHLQLWSATSLFRKEVRQLQSIFWTLLSLQAVFYLAIIMLQVREGIPSNMITGGAAGLLGLFGALCFSLEREQQTAPFLLRLPVSRWRMLGAKLAASFTTWMLLVACSMLLYWAMQALRAPLVRIFGEQLGKLTIGRSSVWTRQYEWYACAGLLSYVCCALCSLRASNVVTAFFKGALLTIAAMALVFGLGCAIFGGTSAFENATPASRTYAAIAILSLTAFFFHVLLRRFGRLEEEATVTTQERTKELLGSFVSIRFNLKSLWALELQQKWALWVVFIATPIIFYAVSSHIYTRYYLLRNTGPSGPLFAILELSIMAALAWPIGVGILSGAMLWTRREADSAASLLYHLPIPRRQLLAQRLISGFLLITLCLAECFAGLNMTSFPIWEAAIEFGRFGMLINTAACPFAAFLIGALLSAYRFGAITTIGLTVIMGALIVAPTRYIYAGDWAGSIVTWTLLLAMLVFLVCWVYLRSRALEPGVNKGARAFAVCAVLTLWAMLINVVDLIDLLYLMGIDLYPLLY
jgi:hypothetical protein